METVESWKPVELTWSDKGRQQERPMSNKVEGEGGHLTHSCVFYLFMSHTHTSPKREKEGKEKRQGEGCQHPCLALTIGVAGPVSRAGLPVWATLLSSGHVEAKDR